MFCFHKWTIQKRWVDVHGVFFTLQRCRNRRCHVWRKEAVHFRDGKLKAEILGQTRNNVDYQPSDSSNDQRRESNDQRSVSGEGLTARSSVEPVISQDSQGSDDLKHS